MMIDAEDLMIRKTIHVDVPVERAFEVFTAGWSDWWPSETHSIEKGRAEIDWRPGGVACEIVGDKRHEWADVLEFDPPNELRLRWRVNPENPSTEVRVTFAAEGGGTVVELVHSGWEQYADDAQETFASYTEGWDAVLGHYLRYLNS